MEEQSFRQIFQLPGTEHVVEFTRAPSGQLLCLKGCGRVYIRQHDDGLHFDDDLAIMAETLIGKTLLRNVKTKDAHWLERYVWGEDERLIEVDGVVFDRDEDQRIISSTSNDGDCWRYRYSDDGPVAISCPSGRRTLRWQDGTLTGLSENSRHQRFSYNDGIRGDAPAIPDTVHRDELGRIWCISAEDGSILTTFLWDGFACLGRIDGSLGGPLAAVYSLDPTCTPVRIITRDEVIRIPRDAFGEALLEYPGNPGLYGGLIWQGYTHLPARTLDSRTGCFTSPDSYDGLETDPRRESGFKGTLFTEHETVNRYAISQYDPIGRTDPTGNLSIWVYLSDFTWSLQNNLVGWFGLDWTVNLFGSLFSGQIGDFFDYEHLESSDRLGLTAVRRDGLMAPGRAWTFQHLVMVPKDDLHVLAQARAIDPQDEFVPTLYGTVLHANPEGSDPFLLRGTSFSSITNWPNGPSNWSRSGGPARPVVPGSSVPYFPAGGLHLDQVITQVPEPVDISLRELEARERSILGVIDSRAVIVIDSTSTGLAVDAQVLVTDTANNISICKLLSVTTASAATRVRLDKDNPGVGPTIRIRQLGSPDAAESLSQTTLSTHLEIQGSSRNYRPGNVLRMSQSNSEVGVRLVEKFEARLELDDAIPDPFEKPITVLMTSVSGTQITVKRTANASAVEYPDGLALPGVGTALLVRGNGNSVPVTVQSLNAREVVMDRSVASTGNDGDDVSIQALARGAQLGARNDDREVDAHISYTPPVIRNAPDFGNVWLEDNSGRIAVRLVKSRIYDAIVMDQALPGNPSNPYDVERFDVSGFDRDGLTIDSEQVLALDEDVDIGSPSALMIQEIVKNASGAITTGTTDSGWTNNTSSVSKQFSLVGNPPNIGRPAEALVINDLTNIEVRRVRSTRVTFKLDRSVTLTAGTAAGLKLVAISPPATSLTYQGKLIGPLQTELPGHGLAVGDEVTMSFCLSGATQILEYRVTQINAGNTLALSGGQTHLIEVTNSAAAVTPGIVSGELLIAALPFVGNQLVQIPRLNPQAIIALTWDNANVNLQVVAASGDRVTLAHRDAVSGIEDLYVKEISFQQMEPVDPANGTAWVGINGRVENGTSAGAEQEQTTELSFEVWSANAVPKNTMLAIADGDRTFPCRVENSSDMDVVITFDRDLGTSVASLSLEVPTIIQTGFAVDFVREDRAIIIRDTPPLFAVTATHSVVVTPMVAAIEPVRLATGGRIGPGTVLVPEDPENWELDRRQSLIDHELIHTRQCATWGPLLLAWFPLFALEGLYEGLTDIEEADYSAYVDAQLTTVNSARFISIPSPGGIEFSSGDSVQLFIAGNLQTIRLGESPSGSTHQFVVTLANNIADQNLRVRKLQNDSNWATARDVTFNIQQVLTHGGILNTLTGSVYGGLFHGIGRLFYAMGRAIFGKGDRHAGTVVSPAKTSITLNDQAGISALRGANRIIIQKGDSTLVRSVNTSTSTSGNTLTLSSAVDFEGEVFVSPYTTQTPDSAWDWNSYYPAQVPNASEPAAIRLFEAGAGDSLTLRPFDRVVVTSEETSNRTNVTHVRDDGIVELEEIPPHSGAQRNLRIAKIDEGDPIGNVDSVALRELGFGWMRWLFDPYGQFQYRLQPDNSSFWGIVARVARYLFGSTSWSLMPILGYYFWDNLFVQIGDNGHFSQMEQEASEESGDLYSPIGRLRGAFSKNSDTSRHQGVVGDIGRYWYFHGNRTNTFIQGGQLDAPGIHFSDAGDADPIRVITDVVATGSELVAPFPNANATSGGPATTPGLVLPDRLFGKNTPLATTVNNPVGFAPGVSGFLPVSASLERSLGMYVSFCRPGRHRITVVNGIVSAQNAIDVQEGDSTFGFGRQTIYFNIDIADVEVSVAGQQVTSTLTDDGAGNFLPQSIELVQLQRARVNVLPNASKRYAITVPHSGKGGHLLTNGTNEIVALNRDTPSNSPEAVEISRHYKKNADGKYDNAVLNAHNGVHLTEDLHIPVRSFLVKVVNTLAVRRAVNLETSDVLDPNQSSGKSHPGDTVYVIIPADPVNTLRLDTVTYPSNPAMVTNPSRPLIEPEPTPEALQAFVGDGVVSKITFQADNPPERTARVTLTVTVGYEDLRADLKAEMEVIPHVTLQAATVLTVQNNGSSIAINAQDESSAAVNLSEDSIRLLEPDHTSASGLTASVSSSTVTITATASATVGRKQILVKKSGDEEHWARLTFEVIA